MSKKIRITRCKIGKLFCLSFSFVFCMDEEVVEPLANKHAKNGGRGRMCPSIFKVLKRE